MNKKLYFVIILASLILGVVSLFFACSFVIKMINFLAFELHYENSEYLSDLSSMILFSIFGLILNRTFTKNNEKTFLSGLSLALNIMGILPGALFILLLFIVIIVSPLIICL